MRIAILMANTDESDFAARHPRDGDKWRALLAPVRPDWEFEVFSVKDGVFPPDLTKFDGAIVTGSPASVRSGADWTLRLLEVLRGAYADGVPLFGACFGHQAIAQALGGTVGDNPGPFILGSVETTVTAPAPWMDDAVSPVNQYAAHGEQVLAPPEGAEVVLTAPTCKIGGFRIGNTVFTTEYHPEMTPAFIAALTEHLDGDLDADVIEASRTSLAQPADTDRLARWIAGFFDHAKARQTSQSRP